MVKKRIEGLDGLRAIAVLVLMAYHSLCGWASGGWLGVDIFFVISGYLITTQLLKPDWRLAVFWWRRLARLWPALIALGTFVMLVKLIHPGPMSPVLAAVTYTFSPSYELGWIPRDDYITHSWSLAVEMQFYLAWAILMLWIRTLTPSKRTTAVAVAVAGGVTIKIALFMAVGPFHAYYTTFARLDGLLIGALLATLPQLRIPGICTILLGGSFAIGCFMATPTSSASIIGFGLATALFSCALISTVAHHPESLFVQILSLNCIQWIGIRSYSLYLWHAPLSAILGNHLRVVDPLNTLAQWVLTFIVAHLSFTLIENPGRIWLNQHVPKRLCTRSLGTEQGAAQVSPMLDSKTLDLSMSRHAIDARSPSDL